MLYELLQWVGAEGALVHASLVPFYSRLSTKPTLPGDTDTNIIALDPIPANEWEYWADSLAEQVRMCGKGTKGVQCLPGIEHTHDDIEAAYAAGLAQLQRIEEHGQFYLNCIKRQIIYRKYGAVVPALQVVPTDINKQEYKALVPDNDGVLSVFEVDNYAFRDVIVPRPDQIVVPNSDGLGYRLKVDKSKSPDIHLHQGH